MNIKEIIREVEEKMRKAIDSTRREFNEVRAGRAHAGLIEGLHVDYYGTLTMFKDLASISIPDPRTIMIQPWDPTVLPEIEKVIANSNLGVSPSSDGKVVRISIPPLSDERRAELSKVVKEMAEKGRISLRSIRRDANEKVKKMRLDKVISEDDDTRGHDEIQKMTDKFIKEVDTILADKTASLTER